MAGWSLPAVVHSEKLAYINFAFARIDSGGKAVFENPDFAPALKSLLALKQRNPQLKVLVSVGGWEADGFCDAALTDALRNTFAQSVVELLRAELDAASVSGGRTGSDRYTLTIASADREYFDHTEMDKLHVHRDWINIMSYDFFKSLTPTTEHSVRQACARRRFLWPRAYRRQADE